MNTQIHLVSCCKNIKLLTPDMNLIYRFADMIPLFMINIYFEIAIEKGTLKPFLNVYP